MKTLKIEKPITRYRAGKEHQIKIEDLKATIILLGLENTSLFPSQNL